MTIEIINGTHTTPPIGSLPGPNGTVIDVWDASPAEWLRVLLACIGDPPRPPQLGPGGELVPITSSAGEMVIGVAHVIGYQYNPSGDVLNTATVAEYQAELTGWNARAATLRQAFADMAAFVVKHGGK